MLELQEKQCAGVTQRSLSESLVERRNLEMKVWLADTFLTLNPLRFVYNLSPARLLLGPMKYFKTELPIDLAATIALLGEVHGYELFQCGMFNGDCHPGNVLLLKDGRLGLIDYGQVRFLDLWRHLTIRYEIKVNKFLRHHLWTLGEAYDEAGENQLCATHKSACTHGRRGSCKNPFRSPENQNPVCC